MGCWFVAWKSYSPVKMVNLKPQIIMYYLIYDLGRLESIKWHIGMRCRFILNLRSQWIQKILMQFECANLGLIKFATKPESYSFLVDPTRWGSFNHNILGGAFFSSAIENFFGLSLLQYCHDFLKSFLFTRILFMCVFYAIQSIKRMLMLFFWLHHSWIV